MKQTINSILNGCSCMPGPGLIYEASSHMLSEGFPRVGTLLNLSLLEANAKRKEAQTWLPPVSNCTWGNLYQPATSRYLARGGCKTPRTVLFTPGRESNILFVTGLARCIQDLCCLCIFNELTFLCWILILLGLLRKCCPADSHAARM